MPRQSRPVAGFAVLALVLAGAFLWVWHILPPPPAANTGPGEYLFCFWNVENLFDDRDDGRAQSADQEYDHWFAKDHRALALKLDHLSKALTRLNGGKGPDILGVAEVENERAAELLRDALNNKLSDPALHYTNLLMKEMGGGRHIAPAILTRLPVVADKTQVYKPRRVLEGHIRVGGQELVVVVAHWTSRLTDKTGEQRGKYGDLIYGRYRAMHKSIPAVDLLVCGDFNDPPDAASVVKHLRATGDRKAVLRAGKEPLLYNLFAAKDADDGFGTYYYDRDRRWSIFDQVVVSPGLLDEQGWACEPDSVATVNTLVRPRDRYQRPWRFGNSRAGDHGYSDHFPITVRLKVQGAQQGQ